MRVFCYGDSNTYGFDPRSYFGSRYPANSRWTDLVAAKTGWEMINAGMNGREIPRQGLTVPEGIDWMLVMLGTNDLLQGSNADAAAAHMEAFLRGLNIEPDKLVLIAPPPMQLGEWVPDHALIDASIQLGKLYESLAERMYIRFVDAGSWNIPLCFDGVHFTEDGHKVFADGFIKELMK